MRRLIEREIKRPLADMILFGELKRGGKVSVDVASPPSPESAGAPELVLTPVPGVEPAEEPTPDGEASASSAETVH
jgi:hypothetical protein